MNEKTESNKTTDIISGIIIFLAFTVIVHIALAYTFMSLNPSVFPVWIRAIQGLLYGVVFIAVTFKVIEKWD